MTDVQRLSGEQSSRSLSRHSMDSIKKQADEANNLKKNSNSNDESSNQENSNNNNDASNDENNANTNENSNDNNINNDNNDSNESNDNSNNNDTNNENENELQQDKSNNTDTNTNTNTNAKNDKHKHKNDSTDNNDKNENIKKNDNTLETTKQKKQKNEGNDNENDNHGNQKEKEKENDNTKIENSENNKNKNQKNKNNKNNNNNDEKNSSNEKKTENTNNNENKNDNEDSNNNKDGNEETEDIENNKDDKDDKDGAKSKESTPISVLTKARKSGDHTPRDVNNNAKNKKDNKKDNNGLSNIEASQENIAKWHEHNKKVIFFRYTKMSRNVVGFLQLSQIITLQRVCIGSNKMVNSCYRDTKFLDLSEYYGTIGSPEFDTLKFCREFLPKWKNVETLSLRYCSHLQASHLDRIIDALTPAPAEGTENENTKVNMKIKNLNLYFCSRLGANTLLKIKNRLGALETLNIGRCYSITAGSNYNAFKQLIGSPIKSLTFSLDPSILKDMAMDVVSDLIHEQSFPNLEEVDLSHGCQILNEVDLSDLQTRVKKLTMPKKVKAIVKKSDN